VVVTAVTPGRRAALAALEASARGRRLDRALTDAVRRLEPRERRFAHELSYGTARLRGRIDHLLERHLHRGADALEARVRAVLRLGAYQLLYMDVPAYAAVSQSVELAPERASGLVNAVLRALARDGADPALFPDPTADPAGWLARWGSHPLWLVERWLSRWTFAEVAELVRLDNEQPPLRLLPLAHDPDRAVARLAAAGIAARPVPGTRSVELDAGSDPEAALEALRGVPGGAIVQDPAASLVVDYVAPAPGTRVADLCAAPGGKALALAARGSAVVAADRSAARLRLLADSVARTGLPVALVVARAERPPLRGAPIVLLDVPCSGTGTLRRHPDARWRLAPGDPEALARVQDGILDGGASVVPPGGLLVYSTCTLEPEENEARVAAFLRRRPDFQLEPTDTVDPIHLDAAGRLAVLPWKTGFDGAFAARLRRQVA
jgi:16S rRNA (cytosine967-C5)-methyltransferase